jgi:hypothetical protein
VVLIDGVTGWAIGSQIDIRITIPAVPRIP